MSGYNFEIIVYFMSEDFSYLNSVDPVEMPHYAAFHLGLLLVKVPVRRLGSSCIQRLILKNAAPFFFYFLVIKCSFKGQV